MNSVPSGVTSETSVSCTEGRLGVVEEYIIVSLKGKLLISPVTDLIVAVQFVKVTFPKLAKS